jgi:hypothetical protein
VADAAPRPASDAPRDSIVGLIRDGVLDPELASLLWLLGEGGLPIHVGGGDPASATRVADALDGVSRGVHTVPGESLEAVLSSTVDDPALLGVVVILGEGRVVACHYMRPPLRDAGGHVRSQGPAVLATWEAGLGSFEHFAWGVIPELAERTRYRPGDFEIEHDRRREFLAGLAAAGIASAAEVGAAVAGYRTSIEAGHRH